MLKPKKYKSAQSLSTVKKFVKKKLYDTGDWATFRFRFLSANPKCYACGGPSKVVDHVVVHRGKEELFWKIDNMIPLCKSCHSKITNLFDRQAEQDVEGKLKWLNDMRLRTGTNLSVKVISL